GATGGVKAVGGVLQDFQKFIDEGNVVDYAVGIVMGSSLTAIVNSFVTDLVSPIIGLAVSANLVNAYVILRCPANVTDCRDPTPEHPQIPIWGTVDAAHQAGAVTFDWGNFVATVINFFLTGWILFFLVKTYTATFRRKSSKKSCPFCCHDIPAKAIRCPQCTSMLNSEVIPAPGPNAGEKGMRESQTPLGHVISVNAT
ncbi:large-conductance mechanosensitive channel, partial [Blyttiomyces helicus]